MLTANRLSSSLFLFDQFVPGFRTKCSVTFCIRKARSSSLEILVCLHFGRKRVRSEAGRELIEFVWTGVRTRTAIRFAPLRSSLLSSPKSRWRLPSMTLRLLRDEKFPILERRTPELFPESAPSDIIGCLSVWCLGSRSKALYGCFLSLPPCRTDRPSRRGVEPSTTKPTNL